MRRTHDVPARAALVFLAAAAAACTGGQGAGGAATVATRPVESTPLVIPLAPAAVGASAAATADTHAVFSLVDNRWLAHAEHAGGLHVPAGSPGFAKYLRFGRPKQPWKLGARVHGRAAAQLTEKKASLDVPLTAAQVAGGHGLSLSVYSPGKRKLELSVNGKKADRIRLRDGWQVVEVPAEDARLVAGENRITLAVGSGKPVAVEWILVGGTGGAPAAAAAASDDDALHLRRGDALAWYVFVPPSARLRVDTATPGCKLTAAFDASDAPAVSGAPAALDLAPLAGKVARLELRVAGCEAATLAHAALELPGPTPTPTRPARPRHVVLWIMDTLRYDRVPLFAPGHEDAVAETPTMARLAETGTLFMNHYPGGNESTVSHASMFTSLRPRLHDVISLDGHRWKFEKGWPTIGQSARDAGLYVAGVTANGHIERAAGYGWGFHAYENPMSEGKHDKDYGYGGDKIVARALEMIEKKKDDPFLLYIGTIDTHVPWRAYEPWVSRYDAVNGANYKGKFKRVATAGGVNVSFMLSRTPPEPRDVLRLAAIYASDVSFQDAQLGKLVDQLEAWGILDDTMIIVTADHGEEFWEHGIAGHGGSLREPVVHVPMLVWYPPLFPKAVVQQGSEGVDIYPTILDALGVPLPPELQGESLIPLAQGLGRGYPRPAIASHWEASNAVRLDRWKLFADNSGASRLYDVVGDPEERTPVGDARPRELRWLTDAYSMARVYERTWRKSSWGNGANMTAQAARELAQPH